MRTKQDLLNKVKINKITKCWVYIGGIGKDGYGVAWFNGKCFRAHRLAYQLFRGTIPKRKHICHHCDNPPCINPNHLFVGTALDNARDCIQKGRTNYKGAKGSKHGHAKLSEVQVLEIRARIKSKEIIQYRAAKIYGVDSGLINGIVHRRIWKHI